MIKPTLLCKEKKLWIRFSVFQKKDETDAPQVEEDATDVRPKQRLTTAHSIYICPLVKNGIACVDDTRSDKMKEKPHRCKFYQNTLDSYFNPKSHDIQPSIEEERDEPHLSTLSEEDRKFRKLVCAMAKCNISFKALQSSAFKDLLTELSQGSDDSSGYSLLQYGYRKISRMLCTLGNEIKESVIRRISNQTVTIMFDGGRIAKTDVIAVTIVPHDSSGKPLFWDFAPSCRTREDYYKLANHYITELDQYSVHVFAFCTDGLASQRMALTDSSIKHSAVVPHMSPIWIHCCNHLTNLALLDAIAKCNFLARLRQITTEFAKEARTSKSISKLGVVCPGYVVTRWLALSNICSFVRKNKETILESQLITPETLSLIVQFEVLLFPLLQLHLAIESDGTRLSDIFPLLRQTLVAYLAIAISPAIQGEALHAVRILLTSLYCRFLTGGQGALHVYSYCCTPTGIANYQQHSLSWIDTRKKPIKRKAGYSLEDDFRSPSPDDSLFSFASLRRSFTFFEESTPIPPVEPERCTILIDDIVEAEFSKNNELFSLLKGLEEIQQQMVEQTREDTVRTHEVIERQPNLPETVLQGKRKDKSEGEDDDEDRDTPSSEDLLGLLEATIESEMDQYQEPPSTSSSSSSSSSSSCSSSASSSYNLRPGKTVIVIDDDDESEEINDSSTTGAGNELLQSTEAESGVEGSATTLATPLVKKRILFSIPQWDDTTPDAEEIIIQRIRKSEEMIAAYPPYVDTKSEMDLIETIFYLFTCNWEVRLDHEMPGIINQSFLNVSERLSVALYSEYYLYCRPSKDAEHHSDSYQLHWKLARRGHPAKLFHYHAWCLSSVTCTEASCERLFSLAKWVVGDRRGRLKLETITHICRILMND